MSKRDEERLVFLLHALIRTLLVERPVEEAYLGICKSVLPGLVLGEFGEPGSHPAVREMASLRYLTRICDYIYALDDKEWSYASCYSASIAVQLIALARGVPARIAIGVKKQDAKMVGHAWVELGDAPTAAVINPGRVCVDDFKVVKRLDAETALQLWMRKTCDSGRCL